MTGRKVGGGTGMPSALAASIQAALGLRTSAKACSGVSPKAAQWGRSGMSAMYSPSSSLKKKGHVVVFHSSPPKDRLYRSTRSSNCLRASLSLPRPGDSRAPVRLGERRCDGSRSPWKDENRRRAPERKPHRSEDWQVTKALSGAICENSRPPFHPHEAPPAPASGPSDLWLGNAICTRKFRDEWNWLAQARHRMNCSARLTLHPCGFSTVTRIGRRGPTVRIWIKAKARKRNFPSLRRGKNPH